MENTGIKAMHNDVSDASSHANDACVSGVDVKPLTFCEEQPDIYFTQMESQFAVAGIKVDETMYNHVISSLEPQYLLHLADIIRNPPQIGRYEAVKKILIAKYTDSDKLIKEMELGDLKPSQLLKRMTDLAGNKMNDEAMKSLWMERLPETVRSVVAIVNGDSMQMALQADKLMEIQNNPVQQDGNLRAEIEVLHNQIKEMQTNNIDRERSNDIENIESEISKILNNIQWEEFNADNIFGNETNNSSRGVGHGSAGALTSNIPKSVREAQQELAENCGFRDEIIWDLLSAYDAEILRNKIQQLMPDRVKCQKAIADLRKTLFTSIWNQRKYTNGTSMSYIFYVMVTKHTTTATALASREYSFHPVFRCKKCDNRSDTTNCCMIYVDEVGRVYQNWKSFINENVLPPGMMISPPNGIYNFDKHNRVILGGYRTPSGTPKAQLLKKIHSGSAVAGLGAACVPIAALAIPVAAPIMTAAGLIGVGVGAFTALTSALNLSDRSDHEQSISWSNNQARASYIGVIGGTVGIAGAGATSKMTSMAAAGKATAGIEVLVNGINVTSIVLSGGGVANGVLDLILKHNDGDEITGMDVLQLSASLVLFTHSLYNFQLASRIANDARVNTLRSYRETLSNRQRKMFDKISKETMRISGRTQGKIDIIRGVNEIPDRQYLNDLFKINKQLNQRNVRPAFGKSGKSIVLNNELPVDTKVLRQSVQHQKGPNILNQISKPIPSTYSGDTSATTSVPNKARLLYSKANVEQGIAINNDHLKDRGNNRLMAILNNMAVALPNGAFILLKQYGMKFMNNIADGHKFEDVILSMAENFPEHTLRYLVRVAQTFIDNMLQEIQEKLKIFIPTESVLYRIVKYVLENYRDLRYEYISQKSTEIVNAIKKYFLSLNPNDTYCLTQKCPVCPGMFKIGMHF